MENNKDIVVTNSSDGSISLMINRAHKHNALSRPVLKELSEAVTHYGKLESTRLIIIQGAGDRYFAAGGDLVDLSTVRTPEATRDMSTEARNALDAIRQCKVPVIAYLNGDAIGGGAELALACDMRLLSTKARIGFIQAKLAITPAWGGGVDLCALVGSSRALRMMSRCEMVTAELALNWGLADAIIADGPNGADMQSFIQPMLQRSNLIMRSLKEQTSAWRTGQTYEERRNTEQQHLVATWTHDDHWEIADHILSKDKK